MNELQEPVQPAKAAEMREAQQWAEAKGHVVRLPKPGLNVPRGAFVRRGPDFRVVRAHTQWPPNKMLTEADYDAGVVATYSIEIRDGHPAKVK